MKGLHPAGLKRLEQLSCIVGRDAADVLNAHFAGTEVYIPNAAAAMREVRNQRFMHDIRALSEQGLSTVKAVAKLCPEYGFSDRHAWTCYPATNNLVSLTQNNRIYFEVNDEKISIESYPGIYRHRCNGG
ncbi:Mor transcription activator family protein [Morganella morganii]|uniref:Mor transcription activator family protein n=1 Tax=Morganella morganii TaxID=582 RepID=UPI00187C5593|nr:Mor transcription activator family protein [Morganella morganii]